MILNEAYVGKSPLLEQAERLLTEMLASKTFPDSRFKYIEKVEELLAKQFGINELHIFMPLTIMGSNIYTVMGLFSFSALNPKKFKVHQGKYGPSFDPKQKVNIEIVFEIGAILKYGLNGEQIMALLLHELGHTFDSRPTMRLTQAINFVQTGLIIQQLITKDLGFKDLKLGRQTIDQITGIQSVPPNSFFVSLHNQIRTSQWYINLMKSKPRGSLKTVVDNITVIKSTYKELAILTSHIENLFMLLLEGMDRFNKRIVTPVDVIRGLLGYKGEMVSDSFAAIHGYGTALTQAMKQVDTKRTSIGVNDASDIPGAGLAYNAYKLMFNGVAVLFDPHPQMLTRVKAQIDMLKNELKKYDEPRMKKMIMNDITQMEKEYDKIMKQYDNSKIRKVNNFHVVLYRKLCAMLFNGYDDWRALFIKYGKRDMNMFEDLTPFKDVKSNKNPMKEAFDIINFNDPEVLIESSKSRTTDDWDPEFFPCYTPKQMLAAGVFEGKYLNDDKDEYPSDWFTNAKVTGVGKPPNIELNKYKVKSRQSLKEWKKKGWITKQDPKGWFQWYCRYYMGRRTDEDEMQIGRWRSYVARHMGQIKANCKGSDECRPKQRQGLLQWAWDSDKDFDDKKVQEENLKKLGVKVLKDDKNNDDAKNKKKSMKESSTDLRYLVSEILNS